MNNLEATAYERLTPHAADIAANRWLRKDRRNSVHDIAREYNVSVDAVYRTFNRWIEEERLEIVDTRRAREEVQANAVRADGEAPDLASALLEKSSKLNRAVVVSVEGANAAYTDEYLLDPSSDRAKHAFKASDDLHQVVAGKAGENIIRSLRRTDTVGVAGGRGPGYAVNSIHTLSIDRQDLTTGREDIQIVSLCGGALVGTWYDRSGTYRSFDADQNAFVLKKALNVQRLVRYMRQWATNDEANPSFLQDVNLSVVILGLGALNTRHNFFNFDREPRLEGIAESLRKIQAMQQESPELQFAVGDIGHHLFFYKDSSVIPDEFRTEVNFVNNKTLKISEEVLKAAEEVHMICAGRQKVELLTALLKGECEDIPINLGNVTLYTDDWTAKQVIDRLDGAV